MKAISPLKKIKFKINCNHIYLHHLQSLGVYKDELSVLDKHSFYEHSEVVTYLSGPCNHIWSTSHNVFNEIVVSVLISNSWNKFKHKGFFIIHIQSYMKWKLILDSFFDMNSHNYVILRQITHTRKCHRGAMKTASYIAMLELPDENTFYCTC